MQGPIDLGADRSRLTSRAVAENARRWQAAAAKRRVANMAVDMTRQQRKRESRWGMEINVNRWEDDGRGYSPSSKKLKLKLPLPKPELLFGNLVRDHPPSAFGRHRNAYPRCRGKFIIMIMLILRNKVRVPLVVDETVGRHEMGSTIDRSFTIHGSKKALTKIHPSQLTRTSMPIETPSTPVAQSIAIQKLRRPGALEGPER